MAKNDHFGVVYSTEHGKICPQCGQPIKHCTCHSGPSHQKGGGTRGDGIVRVGRETKGRKGKGMTIITGIPLAGESLKKLAKELKQKCGTGGTLKDGVIEIQGDHRDKLVEELSKKGYTVKKAGG